MDLAAYSADPEATLTMELSMPAPTAGATAPLFEPLEFFVTEHVSFADICRWENFCASPFPSRVPVFASGHAECTVAAAGDPLPGSCVDPRGTGNGLSACVPQPTTRSTEDLLCATRSPDSARYESVLLLSPDTLAALTPEELAQMTTASPSDGSHELFAVDGLYPDVGGEAVFRSAFHGLWEDANAHAGVQINRFTVRVADLSAALSSSTPTAGTATPTLSEATFYAVAGMRHTDSATDAPHYILYQPFSLEFTSQPVSLGFQVDRLDHYLLGTDMMASISLVGSAESATSYFVELLQPQYSGPTGSSYPAYYSEFTDSVGSPLYTSSSTSPATTPTAGSTQYYTTSSKDFPNVAVLQDVTLFTFSELLYYLQYKQEKTLELRVTARGATGNDLYSEIITRDVLLLASPEQSACPDSLLAADLETEDYQRTESYAMASGEIVVPTFEKQDHRRFRLQFDASGLFANCPGYSSTVYIAISAQSEWRSDPAYSYQSSTFIEDCHCTTFETAAAAEFPACDVSGTCTLVDGSTIAGLPRSDAKGREYWRVDSFDAAKSVHRCFVVAKTAGELLEPECPGEEATRHFYSNSPSEVAFCVDFD